MYVDYCALSAKQKEKEERHFKKKNDQNDIILS